MNRLAAFEGLAEHAWHRRNWKRLSGADREACRAFIRANEALCVQQFEYAANRWLLDQPKPKRFTMMLELVVASNNIAFRS